MNSVPSFAPSTSFVLRQIRIWRSRSSRVCGFRPDMKSLERWSSIFRYFLLPCMWFLSFFKPVFLCIISVRAAPNRNKNEGNHLPGRRNIWICCSRASEIWCLVFASRRWWRRRRFDSLMMMAAKILGGNSAIEASIDYVDLEWMRNLDNVAD